MTTWLFTYGPVSNYKGVYVNAERWYDARRLAETKLGCGHDLYWREVESVSTTYPVFYIGWSGRAASKHDTSKMIVTEGKDRNEDR